MYLFLTVDLNSSGKRFKRSELMSELRKSGGSGDQASERKTIATDDNDNDDDDE